MKKFLVVLLSLGLIAAFSMPAAAADLKVTGSYDVQGGYASNPTLADEGAYSKSAFYQAVRIQPQFKIAEGLTFTMRFDAMEKVWGDSQWLGGTDDKMSSRPVTAAGGTPKLQENIEMEYSYVTFATALGVFDVGYQNCDGWGTMFFNASNPRPKISLTKAFGPMTLMGIYEKRYEAVSVTGNTATDKDYDTYALAGIYKWKGGDAGLLYKYWVDKRNRTAAPAYTGKVHQVAPYVRATFGPVYMEAEVMYFFGKTKEYETAGQTDQDAETLNAGLKAQMNMGPAYFGGQFAYASGNKPGDTTKERQINGLGFGYTPALIIGGGAHGDIGYDNWIGGANGTGTIHRLKFNMTLYQLFGGFAVTPKLGLWGAVTYAVATEKPANYVSNKIGTEVDLTATYKIFDNLSYMVGAGYLFAGDYWKGTNDANKYGNDYMLVNKLSLSF